MTSPTATAEIERLARATSASRWTKETLRHDEGDVHYVTAPEVDIGRIDREEDAAYIAAVSPDVVLGILAEHRAALEKIERAEEGAIIQRILDMSDEEILRLTPKSQLDADVLSGKLALANAKAIVAESERDAALAALRAAEAERDDMRAAISGVIVCYHAGLFKSYEGEPWLEKVLAIQDSEFGARAALQSTSAKEDE